MLGSLFGIVMALWVCVAVLWIMLKVSTALFGNLGTGLMILAIAISAGIAGLQVLIHSEHLPVQMLGWALTGASVWCTLKAAQIGVRKVRAWWAEPVEAKS